MSKLQRRLLVLSVAVVLLLGPIVLLSAFLIGIPILVYFVACLFALRALGRSLRKASADAAPVPWKEWSLGARIGFVVPTSQAGLVLLGLLLTIGAG